MGRGNAPVAMMTHLASYSPFTPMSFFTGPVSWTSLIMSLTRSTPKCSHCFVIRAIRLGPLSPST